MKIKSSILIRFVSTTFRNVQFRSAIPISVCDLTNDAIFLFISVILN